MFVKFTNCSTPGKEIGHCVKLQTFQYPQNAAYVRILYDYRDCFLIIATYRPSANFRKLPDAHKVLFGKGVRVFFLFFFLLLLFLFLPCYPDISFFSVFSFLLLLFIVTESFLAIVGLGLTLAFEFSAADVTPPIP